MEFQTRERALEVFTSSKIVVDMSKVYSCTADSVLERTKKVQHGPVRIRTHDPPVYERSNFGAIFGAWRPAVQFAVKQFPRIVKSRSLQKRSNDTSTM